MICAANGLPCFKDLIAVLFECFSIISLGYLSCRFKLVSSQAKDLNSYLTNLALPMIIFLNIAQMEFRTINLSFLLCVLAAKLLVFLTVTLLTLTISYPTNFGYAGSLSILATQSNDFALGYPLIKLLYGESRPEMLNYLSLMAPIQLLILNPLGIAMLEFQKSKQNHRGAPDGGGGASVRKSQLDLSFFKALATNPLILASIVALTVNLTHGPELPKYITRVSNTIAASFAAPALFVVGLSMYGKFELLLRNPRDLLLSSVMVLTKGLLLPSLVRTIALLVVPAFTAPEEVPYLVDFAFLYGLLPTAPTACIIAKQYGVLQNVVSISMLLSTIMAGPLTLASSVIISPTSVISVNDIENVITQTMETSAVLTLILAPCTLYTFFKRRHSSGPTYRNLLRVTNRGCDTRVKKLVRANPIRVFVLLLALSQIMIGIGGLLWFFIDTTELNDSSQHHALAQLTGSRMRPTTAGSYSALDPFDEPLKDPLHPDAVTTLEPVQILRQLHTGRLLSPRRSWLADHHMELGYKTLSSLRYVMSAGGLMMAQFCILSLLLVIVVTKMCDHATGRRVSEVLLKASVSVLVCLMVWLAYDSEQLVHLPVEASLPSSAQSLCVRLIYNVTILAISLPLYALVIRTDNRKREARKQEQVSSSRSRSTEVSRSIGARALSEPELVVDTFVKRRYVTSSASLSSDASSAATSNTNLDSTTLSSGPPCVAVPIVDGSVASRGQPLTVAADSLSIILDTKLRDSATPKSCSEKSPSPISALVIHPGEPTIFGSNYVSSLSSSPASNHNEQQQQPHAHIIHQTDSNNNINNNNNDHNNSTTNATTDLKKNCDSEQQQQHHAAIIGGELSENEFNGYSILIVFMLINSTLNLFSVAQKLLHEEPVGTFRQIEIIGIAFEFGQGLLTFLIYGTKGLFDWLRCNGNGNRTGAG